MTGVQTCALPIWDTAVNIKVPGGSYSSEYHQVLKRICKLDIKTIYSGHDDPVLDRAEEMLKMTLKNVESSKIID